MSDEVDIRAEGRVGTVLNEKWALERLLGVGGMAAVYAARHRNGARAAVKILHADLSRHPEVRERFQREGYAANRVEHPGVVKVLDDDIISSGPDSGTAYLVMELLEGESLQDRLEGGLVMGERDLLLLAEGVLEVLEAAHARGVVHRDLKPENLFLMRDDVAGTATGVRVKVLDFGLARLLQGQAITTYGLALGTPSFMSPEQAAGRTDEIDGRTDLFALAATAFRLRTGRRIHDGANPVELVTKMASVAAPRIRTVTPEVSEPFARVIDRALEFRREDRYANAAAMREDVQRAAAELDSGAATWLAVPAIGAPDVAGEVTIEVGDEDLERAIARPNPAASPWPEESIRIPRHWPVLPWIALLLFAGVGAKFALDARHRALMAASNGDPSATTIEPPPGSATAASDAGFADAAADSAATRVRAPTSAASSARPVPAPVPVAPGTHRPAAPVDVAPRDVHKLPSPRHLRTTGPRAP